MKTKSQQAEQERLAPIMAEYLGFKKCDGGCSMPQGSTLEDYINITGDSGDGETVQANCLIVYLFPTEDRLYPPGFLAVWDKLNKMADYPKVSFSFRMDGVTTKCKITDFSKLQHKYGLGPDRYTAFYTAIEKMREGER